jgi:aldehyde:ferredoxin oxidoreductase
MGTITKTPYRPAAVERGYTGHLLRVDLSAGTISIETVPPEVKDFFLGGRGYCLWLVHGGTAGGTRYDSPENVLAIAGGPFCGESSFPGAGKFIVGTISPLTGSFVDSNVGGHFFALAKESGFDAIAVTGKSEKQVMLLIDGDAGEISLVDAPREEGGITVAEKIFEEYQGEGKPWNTAVLTAGRGAKNSFFGIVNSVYFDKKRDRCRSKQAGRGGTGTVMRDKGLWGVVVRSNKPRAHANHPADAGAITAAGRKLRKVIKEVDPHYMKLEKQGTTSLVLMMDTHDILPVKNYQYGRHPEAKKIYGEVYEQRYFKQGVPDGCYFGCTLACTKGCEFFELRTGPFTGRKVGVDGPEYETAASAACCGVFDPEYTMEYNWYCDEYGLDTISTGITMAFCCEAFDLGYLTEEDTGGLELAWGNADDLIELVHRIAAGEGFGRIAGRGIRRLKGWIAERHAGRAEEDTEAVRKILDDIGMECKGLEFSVYVTKESLAQQGGYGFALKGAQHDEAWLIAVDQIKGEMPSFEEKARALRWFPLFRTWFNIVGLCKLPWIDVRHPEAGKTAEPAKNLPSIEYYLGMVNATLGTEKTLDDLIFESERLYTFQKLFNLRQGAGTREHDRVPLRAMAPVFVNEYESRKDYYDGLLREEGVSLEGLEVAERLKLLQNHRRKQYEHLCDAVYREKGYDANGVPLRSTLGRLGMDTPEFVALIEEAARTAVPAPSPSPEGERIEVTG